jgi:hypothetical protein
MVHFNRLPSFSFQLEIQRSTNGILYVIASSNTNILTVFNNEKTQ